MNSIIWKGVSSTTIKGLIISELPPISKPEMRIRETVIDGVNGSVIEELGYNPYDKPLVIGLHGNYDINEVIKYFSGEGDVVFSNEPNKVYRAKINAQIDYNRLLRYRQATILFRTQPFKYAFNEEISIPGVGTASGTSIVVNDSEDANLKEFKIYGKSTQDGTPTPGAPIDIVSVGDDGSVNVSVLGGNLIPYPYKDTETFKNSDVIKDDGKGVLTFNGELKGNFYFTDYDVKLKKGVTYTLTAYGDFVANQNLVIWIHSQTEGMVTFLSTTTTQSVTFTPTKDFSQSAIYIHCDSLTAIQGTMLLELRVGNVAEEYEAYKTEQAVVLTTPLRAIPVTDEGLATYTDAEGQMWCADEIDLERGVYVQRIQKANNFSFSKTIGVCDMYDVRTPSLSLGTFLYPYALCTHTNEYLYNTEDVTHFYVDRSDIRVYVPTGTDTEGLTVYALLETPVETPLTEEQIAICKSLKTNNPTTTIFNDENAYMSIEYRRPFEVENKGLETSRPIMNITGSGTVEISVNGVGVFTYKFPEGEKQVVIDSEKEDAYLGSVLKNRNMIGEFPILQPGTNKIGWTGDVEKIEIEPRSRWL